MSLPGSDWVDDAAGDQLYFRWQVWQKDEPCTEQPTYRLVLQSSDSNLNFVPVEDGMYEVRMLVYDDAPDGRIHAGLHPLQRRGESRHTISLFVQNVEPEFAISGPTRVAEGTAVTFVAIDLFDPGLTDILSYRWTITQLGHGTSEGWTNTQLDFTPADDGMYWVELAVSDNRSTVTRRQLLEVTNVAPAFVGLASNATERHPSNAPVRFSGSISDPGVLDLHTATSSINPTLPISLIDNTFEFEYLFSGPGTHQILFQVRDLDGGITTQELTVLLGEPDLAAPVVSIDADPEASLPWFANVVHDGGMFVVTSTTPYITGTMLDDIDANPIVEVLVGDRLMLANNLGDGRWLLPAEFFNDQPLASGIYDLQVFARDAAGNVGRTERVNLVVALHQPTGVVLHAEVVYEDNLVQAVDKLFGVLSVEDSDSYDEFVYELVEGIGSQDNARFRIVNDQIFLRSGELLDYETRPAYNIRVKARDLAGNSSPEHELVLHVTNQLDARVTASASAVSGNVLSTLTNSGTWSHEGGGDINLSVSLGTLQKLANGTWTWSYTPSTRVVDQIVTITATSAEGTASVSFVINAHVAVTRSAVYYKGSAFSQSGNNIEAALDPLKVLAKAGDAAQTLNFSNLINTTRGINGLVFDIAGLATSGLTVQDFEFSMSPTGMFNNSANPPANWLAAPNPTAIVVTQAASTLAPQRVRIEWADNAIANRWLQIRIKANTNTGFSEDQVYYLGHLHGEVNGAVQGGGFFVTTQDFAAVNPLGAASVGDVRDLDKSRFVTTQDLTAVRLSINAVRSLRAITIPPRGSSNE